jgi:hypothetical protein
MVALDEIHCTANGGGRYGRATRKNLKFFEGHPVLSFSVSDAPEHITLNFSDSIYQDGTVTNVTRRYTITPDGQVDVAQFGWSPNNVAGGTPYQGWLCQIGKSAKFWW